MKIPTLDTSGFKYLKVRSGRCLWRLDLEAVENGSTHYPIADDLPRLEDFAKSLGRQPWGWASKVVPA